MKRKFTIVALLLCFSLFQVVAVYALTSSEAKQAWLGAKQTRISADAEYRQAQLDYATDKTPENDAAVISTAKTVLNTVLDEAEAWLNWKKVEAEENPDAPDYIKNNITADVNKNLAKIDGLRTEVNGIENRLQVGVVFLKMVGAYVELLADVARNTGAMWVYIGDNLVSTTEDYEAKLRQAANQLDDKTAVIEKLDIAKSEIATAESKVKVAETAYKQVVLPGTPMIKFAEGNNYLRQAKTNLVNAHLQLVHAYNLILSSN